MTIKFTQDLPKETGYGYKKGDTVESAEEIFGAAQARYFVETGHADVVGNKTEKAVAKGGENPEKTA